MTVRKGASADTEHEQAWAALPFEQRCAAWTLYYASREARLRTLSRRETQPNTPGLNSEMGYALIDLQAVNRNYTSHRVSGVGLRRGLDGMVEDGLARHSIGPRRRHTWCLTSRGRALVGEPRP